MERIVTSRIRQKCGHKIDDRQFGFVSGRNCPRSLIHSITEWHTIIKAHKQCDVVYFDFRKAFDMVSHNILFHKLESSGFPANVVGWYKSLLRNRSSFTRVGQTLSSNELNIESGVVQGTVSGPLLFLFFINDIKTFMPQGINYVLFADDLKIYSHDSFLLQKTIDSIAEWACSNHLPLAPEKINVLHLGKHNKKHSYTISGQMIEPCTSIKDLGITIDNKLNFESHINKVARIAIVRVKQIMASFRFDNPDNYVRIFKTYVLPQIEYGSSVYSPPTDSLLSKTLEKPLRLFSRLVCKRCQVSYTSYSDRLALLNMTPLYIRRKITDVVEVYKIIKKEAYHPNNSFVFSRNSRHPYRLIRQPIPYDNNNWFYPLCEKLWNSIASQISVLDKIDSFKTHIEHLLVSSSSHPSYML